MSSSSEALICRIKTRPHPNADRLLLGSANGYQVVVGLDTVDNSLGVFFSSDLCVSAEYAAEHDLVGYTDEAGVKRGGFFPKNLRVRAQKFRGEKSEGYFAPLDTLAFTKFDISKLKEGDVFSELNGVPLCTKYVTEATKRAMSQIKQARANEYFAKHIDTAQLRHKIGDIPYGSLIYTTLKMHGTSFRVGLVLNKRAQKRSLMDRLRRRPAVVTEDFEVLIGTRNVILGERPKEGFYGTDAFRLHSADTFSPYLHRGEIVYGELVGYIDSGGRPFMEPHNITDKDLEKQYGKQMVYSYGCNPAIKPWEIYVYRITQVSDDNHTVELSWPQLKARCGQLGLKHVPEMAEPFFFQPPKWEPETIGEAAGDGALRRSLADREIAESDLTWFADSLNDGPDPVDHTHIREGIVLRIEQPNGETKFLKSKGWTFRVLEGIAFENPDYVDTEAAS